METAGRRIAGFIGVPALAAMAVITTLSGAASLGAQSAQAEIVPPTYTDCDATDVVNPFTSWGDTADYVSVANGSFENGLSGWTVTGKQTATSLVPKEGSGTALQMSDDARVVSPPICFDETRPHARMFMRQVADAKGVLNDGKLKVKVVYTKLADGKTENVDVGEIAVSRSSSTTTWGPSPEVGTGLTGVKSLVAPDSDGHRWFQYELTADGHAIWQIDDLFVDPRMRH
jgi:hypothetical protein